MILRGAALALVAIAAAVAFTACQPRPLPEADSAAARLYVQRCGDCHRPYDPRSMTASMWETQVTLMDGKMREAGIAPLTDDERRAIMDYLTRNAGTQ